jgi:hypothetical protein
MLAHDSPPPTAPVRCYRHCPLGDHIAPQHFETQMGNREPKLTKVACAETMWAHDSAASLGYEGGE